MGDLGADTAVRGGDGVYAATLSRDWEIWGPMGGYVVAVALRAAGAHSRFDRPASVVAHYLGVAGFGSVQLTTTTMRAAKKAESVRVSVTQDDRPVLETLVWAVADDLPELEHDVSELPDAAGRPLDHPTVQERLDAAGSEEARPYRFWENFEARPVHWVDDWERREAGAPEWLEWLRFVPEPDTRDPWVDAARLAILVDVGSWPAVTRHHVDTNDLYAPSIDLACHFHRFRPDAGYLLARGSSPSGAEGLVTSHQSVWAEDGTFLASGISQLLCRPVR
jgi:acyl-CoA thioesterase II